MLLKLSHLITLAPNSPRPYLTNVFILSEVAGARSN